jgi:hypothetical protein
MDGAIIGTAIFLLLTIFIITVALGWGYSTRGKSGVDNVKTGMFLSPCTTTKCNTGLGCDGNTFTCKLGTGLPCSDASDCVTGLICSGLCVTGPVGGFNQYCPCDSGFLCVQERDGSRICKVGGGGICTSDSDCASDFCVNSICASGAPNSYPCTQNSTCATQNCNNGFCQSFGVITGVIGSACAGDCVGFTGAICNNPLKCECLNGTGIPGTCVAVTQGILSPCSDVAACAGNLVCYQSTGGICPSNQSSCLCAFNYDNPNTQVTGSNCIGGMSPVGNVCYNNNGLGCDSGSQCINSQCGSSSVLAYYRFSNDSIPNLGAQFQGALNTSVLSTLGPSGTISPYKLLSTSTGTIDTIYVVDHIQGLLSMEFDASTETIVSTWTQLIPYYTKTTVGTGTTVEKTLIDVGYNGTTFIVGFNEIVTVGSTSQQNDTVYSGSSVNALSPFNFQMGSGLTGTQYTSNGSPLNIDYIDISPPNDISAGGDALISINGTIYVKSSADDNYDIGVIAGGTRNGELMTGLTGPARFYFDVIVNLGGTGPPVCPGHGTQNNSIQCPSVKNISFVGQFNTLGPTGIQTIPQILQFSGNIAGIGFPFDRFGSVDYKVFDYSIYSSTPSGMRNAGIIMLADAYNGPTFIDTVVAITSTGSTTIVPYRVSNTSRSVVTRNAFYVISIGSCT